MDSVELAQSVVRCFPALGAVRRIVPLRNAGGFSGAQLWRVIATDGEFCLRRWPTAHPDAERLRWIHGVLRHVVRQGCRHIPVPLMTRAGETIVVADQALWELVPWVPGRADFHEAPSPPRLAAALQVLAQFHQAAVSFDPLPRPPVVSPGAIRRWEFWQRLTSRDLIAMQRSVEGEPALTTWQPAVRRLAAALSRIGSTAAGVLREAADRVVPQQPCLRDIWHDHVLFAGAEVCGFVDFGAMGYDSVTTDVARLLGSLVGTDRFAWSTGLAAYEAVRPLNLLERPLVDALDLANTLLIPAQWLQWLVLERRRFEDLPRVRTRVAGALSQLETLAGIPAAARSAALTDVRARP